MKHFAVALFALISLAISAQPCTPDPQYANALAGIYPDTLPDVDQNSPSGYSAVLDIVTNTASAISGYPYVFAERICSISLPAGFLAAPPYNGTAGGLDAIVNGGANPNFTPVQSCVLISGTQAAIADWLGANTMMDTVITVYLDQYVCDGNGTGPANCVWLSSLAPQTCGLAIQYNLPVHVYRTSTGVTEQNTNHFSVGQSYPNPATCTVNIPFNSIKPETVSIGIYTIWGVLVSQTTMQSKPGQNVGIVNTSTLPPGWYMCQVSNGNQTVYKPVIVE